jgi:D-cysteine desulfhydrase
MNLTIDNIVLTSGSSGTHAGTLVGLHSLGFKIPVTGICISRKAELQKPIVHSLINRTADKINAETRPTLDDIVVFDDYVGEGYSRPTKGMAEAIRLLARTEAIVLDPVYTGKAMDGLLNLYRQGYFNNCENILFIHTGGSSALYEYKDQVPV